MFRSIFRPYGLVWNVLNNITDILALSVLWCFCSLPIITVGAASTALYDAVAHGIRGKEAGMYRRFFRTFKAEFLPCLGITVLWGGVLLFCSYVLALLNDLAVESTQAALMASGYRVVMLIPLGIACWSVTILSRFTYGFRDLTATAMRFLIVHLPASAAIAVTVWGCTWFCARYWLPLVFAPALGALVVSFFAEPVFGKYGGKLVVPDEND